MSFFSLAAGREREIRLSFSYVSPEQAIAGVARLAEFIARRIGEPEPGLGAR
jgi:DNA-binding transcriptional MocR family regulator